MSPTHSEAFPVLPVHIGASLRAFAWRVHLVFAVLLVVSLIIPFIHTHFLDDAIEFARAPLLLPLQFLILRDFGHLSRWLPVGVFAQWLFSFRFARCRTPTAIVSVAVALSLLIGFYTLFCAGVLAMQLHFPVHSTP